MNTAKLITLGMLRGSGAAVAFSPLDITGLALWLDASDSTTLFQASDGTTPAVSENDVVGYWGDKSGNLRHETQATTGNKPLLKLAAQNTLSTLAFDGGDFLIPASLITATTITFFSVVKRAGTGERFVIGGQNNSLAMRVNTAHKQELLKNQSASIGVSSTALGDSAYYVLTETYSSPNAAFRLNGAADGSASSAQTITGKLGYIGASVVAGLEGFNGNMAEILVYTSVLSAGDISAVETYLNDKWGAY